MLWMQNKLGEGTLCIQFIFLLLLSRVRDIQSSQAEFQQGMQHQCCGKIPGNGNAAVLGCNSSCGPRRTFSCSYQTSDVRVMALFLFRLGKKDVNFHIS